MLPILMLLVALQEEFTVRLEATPTTGYVWRLREPSPDGIQLLGSSYEEETASDGRPGSSGIQLFRLKALKEGAYTLQFDLKRPWEREAIDVRMVTVEVN